MKTLFKDIKKYIPPSSKGNFEIKHFSLGEKQVELEKMRGMYSGNYYEVHSLKAGKYIKLIDKTNQNIIMSDTPMEMETNYDFVEAASGNVLIGGLGLGLIVMAIQSKKEFTDSRSTYYRMKKLFVKKNPNFERAIKKAKKVDTVS